MKGPLVIGAFVLATLGPRIARGDAAPKFNNAWFVPVGVSGALALHADAPAGFAGGAEVSVVHNDDYDWLGAYADVVHDFAVDATRLSIGPELGEGFAGIDGGYLFEVGNGRTRHGVTVRPMLSLGFVMLYGRVGWLGGQDPETLGEVGLLFKYPIELHNEPSYRPGPPEPELPADPAPPSPSGPAGPPPAGPFAEPPPG